MRGIDPFKIKKLVITLTRSRRKEMGYQNNDYIEVKDRIGLFLAKYPEGSLSGSYEMVDTTEGTIIIYTARAYRHEDDKRPGIGTAQEAFPGKTNFTRGSEIQNAETSAWGRALAGLGIAAHKGVSSAEDILASREREAERDQVNALKAEVLNRANDWAEDTDNSFESKGDLVAAYLDSKTIKVPSSNTSEKWTEILQEISA